MTGRGRRTRWPVGAAVAATAALAVGLVLTGRAAGGPRPGGVAAGPVEVTAGRLAPVPAASAPLIGRPGRLDLSHLPGRGALIDFWSSWCAPCRQELPSLQRAYAEEKLGVAVVGVDVRDGEPAARALLRAIHASFPTVADPHGTVAAAFRVIGTPTTVVVDRHGREVARALGPADTRTLLALMADAAR